MRNGEPMAAHHACSVASTLVVLTYTNDSSEGRLVEHESVACVNDAEVHSISVTQFCITSDDPISRLHCVVGA